MRKELISYVDYNGTERNEEFYFNLTRAECIKLNNQTPGGLGVVLEKIVKANDSGTIQATFEDLLGRAYGVKSEDGRRLIKGRNMEHFIAFQESPAYDELICKLISVPGYAAEFFNDVIPVEQIKDLVAEINKNSEALTDGAKVVKVIK